MFHTNRLRDLNILKTHNELLEIDETIKIRLHLSQNEVLCLGQRDPGMGLIKTGVKKKSLFLPPGLPPNSSEAHECTWLTLTGLQLQPADTVCESGKFTAINKLSEFHVGNVAVVQTQEK